MFWADDDKRLVLVPPSSVSILDAVTIDIAARVSRSSAEFKKDADQRFGNMGSGHVCQVGYRSDKSGYATGWWLVSLFTNTRIERAATLDDFFDAVLLAQTAKHMGRRPVPQLREGDALLDAEPLFAEALKAHCENVVHERRQLFPDDAGSLERQTKRSTFTRGHPEVCVTLHPELFPGCSPGISAATWNVRMFKAGQYPTDEEPPSARSQRTQVDKRYTPTKESNPGGYYFSDTCPSEGQCFGEYHFDSNDAGLAHLALYSLDPHGCLRGGEFFGKLNEQWIGVHRNTNSVHGTFDQIKHAAAVGIAIGDMPPFDWDVDSDKPLGAVAGSIVVQCSKIVADFTRLCDSVSKGEAFAINKEQKHWLIAHGLLPVQYNEEKRPCHKELYALAKDKPINNPDEYPTLGTLVKAIQRDVNGARLDEFLMLGKED